MSPTQIQKILNCLAKSNGRIKRIDEMVEADRSYTDVITQIVAVRSALN
jgi:DNA-binding FrmR family transcriptional regulator